MLKSKFTVKDWEAHCDSVMRATTVKQDELPADKHAFIERCKKDYKFFFENIFPHYAKAPCAKFHIKFAKALRANKKFRGIFEAHRGAAKSVHTNIGYALWLMICDEMKCMLLISDNETKACRLLAALQAELKSNQRIIHYFGTQVSHGDWAEGEFGTKQGVSFFAIGMGQSPNGTRSGANRPDYIVVDDADTKKRCKNPSLVTEAVEWIHEDLIGTFDIGDERFIICNNRIHKQSILATIHKEMVLEKPLERRWYYMQINALDKDGQPTWPEKYTLQYWLDKKADITLRSWELNYMNNPIELGKVFKENWIKWSKMLPLHEYEKLIIYIDPAFKNNATSCFKAVRMWGKIRREFHLIDCWVRQESITDMVEWCYNTTAEFPTNVLVPIYMESNFAQDTLLEAFDDTGDMQGRYLYVIGDERKKPDKYERIESTSIVYQKGFVHYNIDKKGDPDFMTGLTQLLAFEKGSNVPVDAPDADEGALHILNQGYRASKTQAVIGERESLSSHW